MERLGEVKLFNVKYFAKSQLKYQEKQSYQ